MQEATDPLRSDYLAFPGGGGTNLEKVRHVLNDVLPIGLHSSDMEDTPKRWAKMMREFTSPTDFEFTTFPTDHKTMVVVTDIDFVSLCAHHLIPFYGKAHVAYIPNKKLAGLSKLPRTVEYFMRDATTQEELTNAIVDFLQKELNPMGAACIMKAQHLCMSLRGVQQRNALTSTSALTGVFLDNTNNARQEFLSLIP
jgi:GTP cyclohydrolase I